MEIQTITNQRGFTFQALKFDSNPNDIYRVEDLTLSLEIDGVISGSEGMKITTMKNIEDQIIALRPYQSIIEKNIKR